MPALRIGAVDVGDQVSDEYSGIGGLMRPDELGPEMVLKLPESASFRFAWPLTSALALWGVFDGTKSCLSRSKLAEVGVAAP